MTGKHQEKMKSEGLETETGNSKMGRIRILETDLLILEEMASLERKTKGVRKISNFWNNLEQMKKHRTL